MAQTFFPITPTEITAGASGEWTPMDASALIAEGATGVILHVVNTAGFDRDLGLRKNGSTDDRYTDADGVAHFWAMIGVDGDRIFEAYVQSTTEIDIYVVGYTMAGVAFSTNADDKSLGFALDWYDIDCSTEAPSAIGLIFEITGVLWSDAAGLRKNGSSDDRHPPGGEHYTFGAIIGCDGSQVCEGYVGHINNDFFLVGYITDGCTFNLNATDVSLGSAGEYLDLSALPSGANMGFIEHYSLGVPYDFGLRKKGQSGGYYDIYKQAYHAWAIVECDASQIIEGKIENTDADFFVVGYSEVPAVGLENKSANMGSKMIAGKLI